MSSFVQCLGRSLDSGLQCRCKLDGWKNGKRTSVFWLFCALLLLLCLCRTGLSCLKVIGDTMVLSGDDDGLIKVDFHSFHTWFFDNSPALESCGISVKLAAFWRLTSMRITSQRWFSQRMERLSLLQGRIFFDLCHSKQLNFKKNSGDGYLGVYNIRQKGKLIAKSDQQESELLSLAFARVRLVNPNRLSIFSSLWNQNRMERSFLWVCKMGLSLFGPGIDGATWNRDLLAIPSLLKASSWWTKKLFALGPATAS